MATSREIKIKKLKNKELKTTIEKVSAHDSEVKVVTKTGIYWEKIEPNLDLIGAWIRDGLSKKQIAENLGISVHTLNTYQIRYPELHEVFLNSRQKLDYVHMINAYQRRAEGYTTIETEEEYKVHPDGRKELVKIKKRERHIPADPRALENWIQLRMKNDPMWGELRAILHDKNVEVGGEGGLVFIPAKKLMELNEGNNMETTTETTGVHEPT